MRSFTPPGVERGIRLTNRAAVLEEIRSSQREREAATGMLEAGDGEGLERFSSEARECRETPWLTHTLNTACSGGFEA